MPLPTMFLEYDPAKVTVVFRGVPILGFSDGTMVSAERDEDAFTKKTGTQGDVTRVKNLNRGGAVSINLLSGSPTNTLLSALALADETDGSGKGELRIADLNGNTLLHAGIAWIKKLPKIEYADDESGREWMFDCAAIDTFTVGGST